MKKARWFDAKRLIAEAPRGSDTPHPPWIAGDTGAGPGPPEGREPRAGIPL